MISQDVLKEILDQHLLYIQGDPSGVRANLRGANLRGADLSEANLIKANLGGAYLSNADLSEADLRGAYLSEANLRGANLRGANLRGANLRGADLSEANLRGANLRGADLSEANLRGANLTSIHGKEIITFSHGMHQLIYVDGFVRIGCEYHSLDTWLKEGSNIGLECGYNETQISAYLAFLNFLKNRPGVNDEISD